MSGCRGIRTRLVHGGGGCDPYTGAVTTPIYLASTYKMDGLGQTRAGYDYTRSGNPSRASVERHIAELENGVAGFAFASGMAAITTVLSMFQAGDRLLISGNIYGGTYRLLESVFSRFGISCATADMGNREVLEASLSPDVKAIYIETPTNPLMDVTDIALVADMARAHGVLTIVDNTFMTPYLQRPIEFGVDIVIHSATKYLGGHNDLGAGLVVTRTKELAEKIGFLQNTQGAVLPPFDCYLLSRGIKTLGVRLEWQTGSALRIARALAGNPAITALHYPGLEADPGYPVQMRQAENGGAMLSFELSENYHLHTFFRALEVVILAESLGGLETLICHPATMTHAAIPPEERLSMGISDRLIRLSVGIEDAEDIINDLERALQSARMIL